MTRRLWASVAIRLAPDKSGTIDLKAISIGWMEDVLDASFVSGWIDDCPPICILSAVPFAKTKKAAT
jgi:hypothetical protein